MKRFFFNLFRIIRRSTRLLRNVILRYVNPAIQIVSLIAEVINDPKLDVVVQLTESEIDDKILAVLRKVVKKLNVGKVIPQTAKTEEAVAAFVENTRKLPTDVQKAIYFKLASMLTKGIAKERNWKLSNTEADTLTQLAYKAKKQGFSI